MVSIWTKTLVLVSSAPNILTSHEARLTGHGDVTSNKSYFYSTRLQIYLVYIVIQYINWPTVMQLDEYSDSPKNINGVKICSHFCYKELKC